MKKQYISPEMEVIQLRMVDVVLYSPTDSMTGTEYNHEDLTEGDEIDPFS